MKKQNPNTTRADAIQVKVELLLQLSTCSKVEGNGRNKQTPHLHGRTQGLLIAILYKEHSPHAPFLVSFPFLH